MGDISKLKTILWNSKGSDSRILQLNWGQNKSAKSCKNCFFIFECKFKTNLRLMHYPLTEYKNHLEWNHSLSYLCSWSTGVLEISTHVILHMYGNIWPCCIYRCCKHVNVIKALPYLGFKEWKEAGTMSVGIYQPVWETLA